MKTTPALGAIFQNTMSACASNIAQEEARREARRKSRSAYYSQWNHRHNDMKRIIDRDSWIEFTRRLSPRPVRECIDDSEERFFRHGLLPDAWDPYADENEYDLG